MYLSQCSVFLSHTTQRSGTFMRLLISQWWRPTTQSALESHRNGPRPARQDGL
jgi:hypothetical protein